VRVKGGKFSQKTLWFYSFPVGRMTGLGTFVKGGGCVDVDVWLLLLANLYK
jgi:hypothetical protein